jgi:Holliday junction DNA helicase RuvA
MIHSIFGTVFQKSENFVVVEAGGVGYKIFMSKAALPNVPNLGLEIKLFTYLQHRDDAMTLYGFLSGRELELFERLITVSGVGPKSAMGIMGVANVDQLAIAINEGKVELLTRVSGVGKKTAERVVLELKGKLSLSGSASAQTLGLMESDADLEDTLVSLGYTHGQAKSAIAKIEPSVTGFKERLREALKKAK